MVEFLSRPLSAEDPVVGVGGVGWEVGGRWAAGVAMFILGHLGQTVTPPTQLHVLTSALSGVRRHGFRF